MTSMQAVLLVSAAESLQKALSRGLDPLPCDFLTARSPAEALEILAVREVDVVLTDEDLPDGTGADFVRSVRDRHPGSVRILLCESRSIRAALQALNRCEVHRFLTLPCVAEDLRTVVQVALRQARSFSASRELEAKDRRRRRLLRSLESECPGITRVERDASGAILIPPPDPAPEPPARIR